MPPKFFHYVPPEAPALNLLPTPMPNSSAPPLVILSQFVLPLGGVIQLHSLCAHSSYHSRPSPYIFLVTKHFPSDSCGCEKPSMPSALPAREGAPKSVFADEDAIVRFGVGKNMVSAIKHWSLATEFMEEDEQRGYRPTSLAAEIFKESGLDPFCEHPTTAWLVHWKLAGIGRRSTTWRWLFNCVVEQTFDKEGIVQSLKQSVLIAPIG